MTLITMLDSFRWIGHIHPDLLIARSAGRTLFTAGALHVYATHPRAQMGPGALLLSLVARPLYLTLVAILLAPVLLRLADAGLAVHGRRWTYWSAAMASGCAVVCIVPWTQLVWKGHADDALVLAGAALALPSRADVEGSTRSTRGRRLAGIAVAALGKPTALIVLAVAAGWEPAMIAAAIGVLLAIWAPFAMAGPAGFFHAGGGVMRVGHASLPDYLGYRLAAPPPSWIRAAQLGGGLILATVLVLRRRPGHALLAGFCLRALLDPNPAPAYSISVVVLALAVDAGRRLPWATGLAAVSFWSAQPVLNGGTGWIRITALLALLLALSVSMVWPTPDEVAQAPAPVGARAPQERDDIPQPVPI